VPFHVSQNTGFFPIFSTDLHSVITDMSVLRYVNGQVYNRSCSLYLCHLLYVFGLSSYLTENSLPVVQTSLRVIYMNVRGSLCPASVVFVRF